MHDDETAVTIDNDIRIDGGTGYTCFENIAPFLGLELWERLDKGGT
jgi:hypothetical protein